MDFERLDIIRNWRQVYSPNRDGRQQKPSHQRSEGEEPESSKDESSTGNSSPQTAPAPDNDHAIDVKI